MCKKLTRKGIFCLLLFSMYVNCTHVSFLMLFYEIYQEAIFSIVMSLMKPIGFYDQISLVQSRVMSFPEQYPINYYLLWEASSLMHQGISLFVFLVFVACTIIWLLNGDIYHQYLCKNTRTSDAVLLSAYFRNFAASCMYISHRIQNTPLKVLACFTLLQPTFNASHERPTS